ncbi:MAG: 16S rRNA (uracil(1498)-N(3))-methyltransferase [Shimia sp.]
MAHVVRLFVDQPLGPGQTVPLDAARAHRLFGVMRLGVGDGLRLFDGRSGEWAARVTRAGKKAGEVVCEMQTAPLRTLPDVWLCFAPIRRERTDFIVEKAAELGCARIVPVRTAFTNAPAPRADKLRAHAVAAVEQCGGTVVPEMAGLAALGPVLDAWDPARRILFCDEGAPGAGHAIPDRPGPWAIFVGPEGGWAPEERERLRAMGHTLSLGPRILRADTATVAALTLWQAALGDWVEAAP